MPDFHFTYPIEVRYSDLDPQGHVNNANFLTYIEQARINYIIALGLFSKEQSFADVGIILADVHVTFLAPIFFGQQVRVALGVTRLGVKSMNMEYRLFDAGTNTELAVASTVLVSYDYRANKSIPIPDFWRKTISEYEKTGL
jgi:acyl-CoA thioester hydrolase